jgi:hypothetical protein
MTTHLITLTFQSMAAQSCEQPPLVRRLPSTLTIGKVKAMLARHFGLDVDLQALSYAMPTDQGPPTPFDENDDDDATLASLLPDGCTVYLHEVDVRARQAQVRQHEADAYTTKIQQQEQKLAAWTALQKQVVNGGTATTTTTTIDVEADTISN